MIFCTFLHGGDTAEGDLSWPESLSTYKATLGAPRGQDCKLHFWPCQFYHSTWASWGIDRMNKQMNRFQGKWRASSIKIPIFLKMHAISLLCLQFYIHSSLRPSLINIYWYLFCGGTILSIGNIITEQAMLRPWVKCFLIPELHDVTSCVGHTHMHLPTLAKQPCQPLRK